MGLKHELIDMKQKVFKRLDGIDNALADLAKENVSLKKKTRS